MGLPRLRTPGDKLFSLSRMTERELLGELAARAEDTQRLLMSINCDPKRLGEFNYNLLSTIETDCRLALYHIKQTLAPPAGE